MSRKAENCEGCSAKVHLRPKPLTLLSLFGFPGIYGYFFGGPYNKNCNVLGPILGSSCLGKLPFMGYSYTRFRA